MFKIGDLVIVEPKAEQMLGISKPLQAYVGRTGVITALGAMSNPVWGIYHQVKFAGGKKLKCGECILRKIEPPREDLKLVERGWKNLDIPREVRELWERGSVKPRKKKEKQKEPVEQLFVWKSIPLIGEKA